jgi:D-3-phosphoglycerate dehydrogenase
MIGMNSPSKKLAYFDQWVAPVALEILGARPDIALCRLSYTGPEQETWKSMAEAHGYQISPRGELREPWFANSALIERCPKLLAITSTGSGYDMIDIDACSAAGIIVCSQTGSNRISVAEHAMGLVLGLVKRLAVADKAIRRNLDLNRFDWAGEDLHGKTVGIVGLGQIGSRMGELCTVFGSRVIAFDPFLSDAQVAERGAQKVKFNELLKQADIVSVHCPRNRQTLNMFSANEFAAMKSTAYFVSTARGGIHDEQALAMALKERRIAGAGVDVFLEEPPALTNALLQTDAVIATPHTAGLSREALHTMARYAAEQWLDIFNGLVPPRLINAEAWPTYRKRFANIMGFEAVALSGFE